MTKIKGSSFDMYDKSEKAAEYRNCVEGVIDSNEVGMLEMCIRDRHYLRQNI